jgi:hypothetical protein
LPFQPLANPLSRFVWLPASAVSRAIPPYFDFLLSAGVVVVVARMMIHPPGIGIRISGDRSPPPQDRASMDDGDGDNESGRRRRRVLHLHRISATIVSIVAIPSLLAAGN